MKNFIARAAVTVAFAVPFFAGVAMALDTPAEWEAKAEWYLTNAYIHVPNSGPQDAAIFMENGDIVQTEYIYDYFNPELDCILWEDGSLSCE